MKQNANQFRVRQSPSGSCKFFGVLLLLYFFIGGPMIFGAMLLWGSIGAFAAFVLVAILLTWLVDRKVVAKAIVTADALGITIEVVRKGMGIPLGSSFSTWEQLRGFQYSTLGRGPNQLTLLWVNGHKISFQEQETNDFYNYLVQTFPEKEKAYWWPPSP